VLAALIVTLVTTPRYTAETSVQINNQTAQILGKDSDVDAASELANASDTDRFLQTQMDIIKSRAIAERVAQRLNLVGNPDFYKAMGKREDLETTPKPKILDDTLKALLDHQTATMPRNSRLATITFTATDPVLAAKIANAWADEFIQANLQRRFDSSAYARDFISSQLNEARAKLEQSERDLNGYARAAGLIKTRDQSSAQSDSNAGMAANSVTTASLLQLNLAANQAEQNRIAAQQRWAAVSHGDPLGSPEVVGNQTMGELLTQRAQVEGELQAERARHLDDFPTVQKLKAQQASINHQVDALANGIRNSVKQQYDAAVDQERNLKAQVDQLKGSSLAEQDKMVRYNLLARDADTNRSLYESLLQRYKELTASAGISASNIAIIDRAAVPIKPSAPKIIQYLAVGLVLGVLLAAAAVTVRHQMDDAVHIPEDVGNKLHIPLLGVIPTETAMGLFEALADPKSRVSEGYSSLRSSLLFSTADGIPRSIGVTSSQPAEGKSTTALALAQSIAKLGRTVVLLDVDLRRPAQHAMLGVPNQVGVSSLLTRQAEIEQAVGYSETSGIHFITSGPLPPSPSDLLSSDRMTTLIHDLEQRYDVVVLDCPPVMGFADAPHLSNLVRGTVFVIQADRGRRGSLRSSIDRLRGVRANILGGVLTMFDPNKAANRYTDYYGYDYYRYSDYSEKS
jgi:polysaccharide biosynthesis transport protein